MITHLPRKQRKEIIKMTQELIVFDRKEDCPKFEDHCKENGITYWLESELSKMLGYKNLDAVKKASQKAMSVCMTAGIPINENFIQIVVNGVNDVKLTRFACYLVVMNGDISNPRIANAQAYFASLAENLIESTQIDRVYLRGEITEREKTLSHVAKQHGVSSYPFFHNAGYRGMYNMNISALKNKKGLRNIKDSLLDFMDTEELAANIFRISQTEAKIKAQNIQGQRPLENAAETVGRTVRDAMIKNTGIAPEELKLDSSKINEVKKGIKQTHRNLKKIDN